MKRDVFQAIADPTRRSILSLLASHPMTPNSLAEEFESSRQAVSKHIKFLTECQLVKQQKLGREIYYHFNPDKMNEIDQWIQQFRTQLKNRFNQLDDVLINLKSTKMKTSELLMSFSVDRETNRINVKREFAAPVSKVWAAWTQSELLDRWWAPKPWQAKTKTMDFREGGYWIYAMVGPDGTESWARADYKSVTPFKKFTGEDAFCDENGNINFSFPRPFWTVEFNESNDSTFVSVEIAFKNLSDLEKYIELGFKEGFTAALENLDELLR